ncbi:MAG TPA: phage baseplate assembly protein V [Verrucomicrobiae bacterium]|nr:phage baseplate assembly protein V [Verrucomicrobiae bacterium]
MDGELIDRLSSESETRSEFHAFSITTATVIDNIDSTGQMRVQVRIPWLPDIEPWVRVAVLMAGPQRGTFFIPQVDDEVLVAFNQGDIRESYVIGCLWNGVDEPPTTEENDAVSKRMIRTPKGLQIVFDDDAPSIEVTIRPNQSSTDSGDTLPSILMNKDQIVLQRTAGTDDTKQSITLDENGITIEVSEGDITLKAAQGTVRIEAETNEQSSSSRTEIESDGDCVLNGEVVRIN